MFNINLYSLIFIHQSQFCEGRDRYIVDISEFKYCQNRGTNMQCNFMFKSTGA